MDAILYFDKFMFILAEKSIIDIVSRKREKMLFGNKFY